MIKVLKSGLVTTLQDGGRQGYYHLGIPPSGALDQYALHAANRLVGNTPQAAVLESTLLGPELEFQEDAVVAITGAIMPIYLDANEMPMSTSFTVRAGQVLRFGYMRTGGRGYIAISGGIDVPEVLASRSTYVLGGIGGMHGRALKQGDLLTCGPTAEKVHDGVTLPRSLQVESGGEVCLRVVPGLYSYRLLPAALDQFFADTWVTASEADRTGYRFKGGSPLAFEQRDPPFGAGADPSNIVDACYPIGSIQIPGGLEPIVLHRDAVSAGGYATLGTVIGPDLDRIAQLQPNQRVQFQAVTLEQALEARKKYNRRLARLDHFFGKA